MSLANRASFSVEFELESNLVERTVEYIASFTGLATMSYYLEKRKKKKKNEKMKESDMILVIAFTVLILIAFTLLILIVIV